MRTHLPKLVLAASLLAASAAIAWHPDYAWHDVAAPTSSPSIKPGGAGIYGTGGQFEGGIRCEHCHLPAAVTPPLDVSIAFNPPLNAGRYSPGTRYTVTVALVNERFTFPDGGTHGNAFAATFEDGSGNVVGRLESDSGQIQTSCPPTLPASLLDGGTTLLYGDCHGILGRATNLNLNRWVFWWTAPASSVGPITVFYGAVDGNGNDRTMTKDGGPEDAVKMGSLTLQP